jgi:hypothetical protein
MNRKKPRAFYQSALSYKVMKKLSYNLMLLVLATVFTLAPIQNVIASVSSCMNTNTDMQINNTMKNHAAMHQQMSMPDSSTQQKMQNSESKHDCCDESKSCHTIHCASVTAVMFNSSPVVDVIYSVNRIVATPKISLVSFYSSSLFRPPKI